MRAADQERDKYLRHLAFQLAADLPEDIDEARFVLALLHEIVERFFAPDAVRPLRLVREKDSDKAG